MYSFLIIANLLFSLALPLSASSANDQIEKSQKNETEESTEIHLMRKKDSYRAYPPIDGKIKLRIIAGDAPVYIPFDQRKQGTDANIKLNGREE
jgi:hypothetical protein